ncbi:MAG TPA: 1,2-phenylacetyl-CoA epoxidase subunit PaaE [Candidatus Dormibacteraeota bacterium]|nr:1,2-phenylacetyl-CoA epoxidase subunit PaaE [Candidatus Dormibacteraeota bacterium]
MSATPGTVPAARRHAVLHELRVTAVEPLTDDSVTITFAVPPELGDDYAFTQGQHVSVRCTVAGDEVRRSYSICTPAGSGVLRIAVKRLEGGVFSGHAHTRLRAGDMLEVMTPTGRFHTPLDPASARHHVAIAAGSGITPVLSIIATTLAVEPRSRVTLLYGNRTSAGIMFLEELFDLKNRHPERFQLVNVLSRERLDAELLSGRIDAQRLGRLLDALLPGGADEWFVCGPRAMIEGARATLLERGVEAARIHSELFHSGRDPGRAPAAPAAAGAGESRVTILLDGRSSTVTLAAAGEPILDAALRVRADAPFACKDGVCGTCRARVVSGRVSMDGNQALEPDEVAAGFVLACQSHPVTPEVTLDFDG